MSTLFGSSSTFGDVKSAWRFGDEREDTSAAGSFTTSDASSDAPDAPLSEEESFLSAIDTFPATSTGGAISEECFACWGAELAGSCTHRSRRRAPSLASALLSTTRVSLCPCHYYYSLLC